MNKRLIFLVVFIFAMVATIPVSAAWTQRISGGMSSAVNYPNLTVTLSAWENSDGTYGGQGQYYYPPLSRTFHLVVEKICTGTVGGTGRFAGQPYVVAIGPVTGQDGTEVTNGFGAIAVAEGDENPDGVRVMFDQTWEFVELFCEAGAYNIFPAIVVDGNFNIRSK